MNRDARFDDLVQAATSGHLSRRALLKRGVALGLSAPAISLLLAACGGGGNSSSSGTQSSSGGVQATVAQQGAATPVFRPSAASPAAAATTSGPRGGKGDLKLLYWQAPTILNPHLSQGTKDFQAARIVLEPLADFDKNTQMVPFLAAEIPSLDNGAVSKDGKSVTWKLRQGVKWHDGQPFTANDVKFTYQFLSDKATAASTIGNYTNVASVDVVDDYTVKVNFTNPEPAWYQPFTGENGMILPQHILKDSVGASARNAPFNLRPIGTGPFKVTDFRPGDVVTYAINQDYWDPSKPHFDSVTLKGGGDATSAARAVLQTGEQDYAWNIQVEPNVLQSMQSGGKGKILAWIGGGTERLLMNFADPQTEVNGEKAYYQNPHPHFKVKEVRQAMNNAIDRKTVAEQLYGPGGTAAAQTQTDNTPYMLPQDQAPWKFDLNAAKQLLDQAGAKPGPDGVRALNDRPMKWLYQTSVNSVRQKTQEIVKQALTQLNINVELKSIDSSVFFSGDPGNNDTDAHFYADLEMYTNGANVFPLEWYRRYLSADPAVDIAQKSNQWGGRNYLRYQSDQFNTLWKQAQTEIDPAKSVQLFQQMQKVVLDDVAEIPIVARNNVACVSNRITGNNPTQWADDTWDIRDWTATS